MLSMTRYINDVPNLALITGCSEFHMAMSFSFSVGARQNSKARFFILSACKIANDDE